MISLQPSNHLPFPFPLTSKFRVSSTFFIPFLCATILSSFKPSSGLLVIISHREDSTSHLMKDEQASAVSCAQSLSPVRLLETLRTVACQAPLFMGFSWQEYWSGLPFPPPGHLAHPGIEPTPPALQADSLPLSPRRSPSVTQYTAVNLVNVFFSS